MLAFAGTVVGEEAMAPKHVLMAPADLTWGDAPPIFEKGASFTVVSGNPFEPGLYVVRMKMPAGYKIAAHWHPTDEHVTVLSGTMALGMGEKFDEKTMTEIPIGGYALLPANMRHFAMAKTEATIQVHGEGPFKLTYVNPADDPSTKNAAK